MKPTAFGLVAAGALTVGMLAKLEADARREGWTVALTFEHNGGWHVRVQTRAGVVSHAAPTLYAALLRVTQDLR